MNKTRLALLVLLGILSGPAWGDAPSALEDRLAHEHQWISDGLFIIPYRQNYFMPMSYNPHPNNAVYPAGTAALQDVETKMQISFKIPLAEHILKYPVQPVIAYTQLSYWQAYNKNDSSLFRETDYEPEFFLQVPCTQKVGWFTNRFNRIGFDHQSNGEADPLSRSWNRLYAEFVFDYANSMISFKPWYRLTGPSNQDTNPNMWKYYGYGELNGALKFWGQNEVSFLFRNNLDFSENKGAIELGWSFPLIRRLKGFVQYFNGYGDSLINYNVPISRTSVGFLITDWL